MSVPHIEVPNKPPGHTVHLQTLACTDVVLQQNTEQQHLLTNTCTYETRTYVVIQNRHRQKHLLQARSYTVDHQRLSQFRSSCTPQQAPPKLTSPNTTTNPIPYKLFYDICLGPVVCLASFVAPIPGLLLHMHMHIWIVVCFSFALHCRLCLHPIACPWRWP